MLWRGQVLNLPYETLRTLRVGWEGAADERGLNGLD